MHSWPNKTRAYEGENRYVTPFHGRRATCKYICVEQAMYIPTSEDEVDTNRPVDAFSLHGKG